jgi:hypothetical protein
MDRCNPIVPDGVICELRYNIIDDPDLTQEGLMPIDPRSKSTDNVDRFYPIGLSKLTVILLGSSIQMMNEVKKTCTGFWADKEDAITVAKDIGFNYL